MKIKKKAVQAAKRYLELMGHDVQDIGWCHEHDKADIITKDNGDLVFSFVFVSKNQGAGIPEAGLDRKKFERLAAAYLTAHPEHADCLVRADTISLLVLAENRAIVRHHVNAIAFD